MQIVGADCIVCGKRIRFAPEADGCPDCEVVFHKACLSVANLCPQCSGDYAEALQARSEKLAEQKTHELESGRRIVLYCSGAMIGLNLITMGEMFWLGDTVAVAQAFVQTVLLVAACLALYSGFRLARVWLSLALSIAVLILIGQVVEAVETNDLPLLGATGVFLVIYVTILAYVALSTRVTRFMDSYQQRSN